MLPAVDAYPGVVVTVTDVVPARPPVDTVGVAVMYKLDVEIWALYTMFGAVELSLYE